MRRIFMQVVCGYPHKGAAANYLENLAKLFVKSGYEVVLISDLNKEYSISEQNHFSFFDGVYEVTYSENEEKRELQREHGFAEERIGVLEKLSITSSDIVFLYEIWNEYILEKLFEYRKEKGFKVICGVTELFALEDYKNEIIGRKRMNICEHLFSKSDAILTVSDFIADFYKKRNVRVYNMPPFIEFCEERKIEKEFGKKKFLVSTSKDSFEMLLNAFCLLSNQELEELELHICGVPFEKVKELLSEESWQHLCKCLTVHKWMRYEEMLQLYEQIHFLAIVRKECQRTLANFPSKVPETMAYGIVPVVSEVGDYTKYYLEDGRNSIFIDGDNTEEIVKSIRKALDLSQEEYEVYSKEARKCAKSRFDYRNGISEIRNMIESV